MGARGGRLAWRKARTAAAFPSRLVAIEDSASALGSHVAARLDEMRYELAELRRLVTAQLEADAETTALLGRLLSANEERLGALEAAAAETAAGGNLPSAGAP